MVMDAEEILMEINKVDEAIVNATPSECMKLLKERNRLVTGYPEECFPGAAFPWWLKRLFMPHNFYRQVLPAEYPMVFDAGQAYGQHRLFQDAFRKKYQTNDFAMQCGKIHVDVSGVHISAMDGEESQVSGCSVEDLVSMPVEVSEELDLTDTSILFAIYFFRLYPLLMERMWPKIHRAEEAAGGDML